VSRASPRVCLLALALAPARGAGDQRPETDHRQGSVYRQEEGWVEAGGSLWHYREVGRGPSLVVLKAGASTDLLPTLLPLARTSRLVLLDRPADSAARVEAQVAQLEAVRTALKLGRIALLGSPGGLAEAYARKHPARVRMVLAADVSDPGAVLAAARSGLVKPPPSGLRSGGRPAEASPAPRAGAAGWMPRFENEYVRVRDLELDPGQATPWQEWKDWRLDFAYVVVSAADIVFEHKAAGMRERVRREAGLVHYVGAAGREEGASRVSNAGTTVYRQLRIELLLPRPSGFAPSVRPEAPGCSLVLDNERLRAWRLALEPGQAAPPVTGSAPGLRIFLTAGRVGEAADGLPERVIEVEAGGFEWQAPSAARSVRNPGKSRVELVEFELK
jgi:pimeloyl-ACP methyl ester carboxylesterase